MNNNNVMMETGQPEHYPTLKEVRSLRETHGPLIAVNWVYHASGMMMGDGSSDDLDLRRNDGKLQLTHRKMDAYCPIIISIYEAEESLLEQLQAISDRENLPAWEYLKVNPDKRLMVLDFSSSSSIRLVYDDSDIGSIPCFQSNIDEEAVSQQDGDEVYDEIVSLLREACREENLKERREETNPYAPDGPPWAKEEHDETIEPEQPVKKVGEHVIEKDGSWTCGHCGAKGNTGRFCCECGYPGPGTKI